MEGLVTARRIGGWVDAAEKIGKCLRIYVFRKSDMRNETGVAYFMFLNREPA